MASLSRATGISTSTLSDYGRGKMPRADKALAIAEALRVNVRWLLGGAGPIAAAEDDLGPDYPVRTEVRGAGAGSLGDVRRLFYGDRPLPMLPLLGSAVGDDDYGALDEHIQLTELHLSDILDYIPRPAALADDPDAYALSIVGDSMQPRFRPGERVGVSPRASVGIGDDVIVQLRGREEEDERVKMVLVKTLVRRSSTFIELRQYNPDVTFRVDARQIAKIHKVRGNYF